MSTRTYPLKVERWGQGGRACRQQGAPPPCPFLRRAIRLVAHGYRLDDPPDFWTREEACDMLADLGHDDVEQPPAAPQRAERVPAIAGHTVADLLGVDRDGRAQPPGAVPSAAPPRRRRPARPGRPRPARYGRRLAEPTHAQQHQQRRADRHQRDRQRQWRQRQWRQRQPVRPPAPPGAARSPSSASSHNARRASAGSRRRAGALARTASCCWMAAVAL
jgi:hypothetical protein